MNGAADGAANAEYRLRVAGVRADGSGYPNAARTIDILVEHGVAVVSDLGYGMPDGLHLWRWREKNAVGKLVLLARIVLLNGYSALRVLVARRDRDVPVYVPYPSIFFLWLLSWLPQAVRPACIADAYISIWDAMFRDRDERSAGHLGRIVKAIEGRALRSARVVVVDTEANRAEMTEAFDLDPARVHAWPLAIDEAHFLELPLQPVRNDEVIRVLFVGTLIPLHGMPALLGAMRLLAEDSRLEFSIVGDGQMSPLVEEFIVRCPSARLRWIREWQSLDQIAQEIARADICLGVFGGDAKASRVLPLKLYMYLAAGKAVVSQEKLSTPDGVSYPPIESVSGGAQDIATSILLLANNPPLRRQREKDARDYFRQWLGNAELVGRWRAMLTAIQPEALVAATRKLN